MRKAIVIVSVILVLAICAGLLGTVSGGFKNWDTGTWFKQKPVTPEEPEEPTNPQEPTNPEEPATPAEPDGTDSVKANYKIYNFEVLDFDGTGTEEPKYKIIPASEFSLHSAIGNTLLVTINAVESAFKYVNMDGVHYWSATGETPAEDALENYIYIDPESEATVVVSVEPSFWTIEINKENKPELKTEVLTITIDTPHRLTSAYTRFYTLEELPLKAYINKNITVKYNENYLTLKFMKYQNAYAWGQTGNPNIDNIFIAYDPLMGYMIVSSFEPATWGITIPIQK